MAACNLPREAQRATCKQLIMCAEQLKTVTEPGVYKHRTVWTVPTAAPSPETDATHLVLHAPHSTPVAAGS